MSQSRLGRCGEEKTLLPVTRIEPHFLCRLARNVGTIQTELTRLLKDDGSFWTCTTYPGELTNVMSGILLKKS
jgi:hypothetical protein